MEEEIDIENIVKVCGGEEGSVKAQDKISFDVTKNESMSMVGLNGCGKSDLLGIKVGLYDHHILKLRGAER